MHEGAVACWPCIPVRVSPSPTHCPPPQTLPPSGPPPVYLTADKEGPITRHIKRALNLFLNARRNR